MKNLIIMSALLGLMSCGPVEQSCDMNGYSMLCQTLLGDEKQEIEESDYVTVAEFDLFKQDTQNTINQLTYAIEAFNDKSCSIQESGDLVSLQCPDQLPVYIDKSPEIEVITPCDGAKEIMLKIGSDYIAYYSKRHSGFLTVLKEGVRYRTTDGTSCYFSI